MTRKLLKAKSCRNCKAEFVPFRSLQVTCNVPCAIEYSKKRANEKLRQRDKRFKAEADRTQRRAREKLRTRSDYLALAQMAFNKYIRLRDRHETCISCKGVPKKRNAGHYRSVGAAPELRFCEDNCHLQCEHCNTFKSGNAIEYRINLIKKLGVERVEWIEGPHDPLRLTINEIKALKVRYAKKSRDIEITIREVE